MNDRSRWVWVKVFFDSSSTKDIREEVVKEIQQFVEHEQFLQEATDIMLKEYPQFEGDFINLLPIPSFTIDMYVNNVKVQQYNSNRYPWVFGLVWEEEKTP